MQERRTESGLIIIESSVGPEGAFRPSIVHIDRLHRGELICDNGRYIEFPEFPGRIVFRRNTHTLPRPASLLIEEVYISLPFKANRQEIRFGPAGEFDLRTTEVVSMVEHFATEPPPFLSLGKDKGVFWRAKIIRNLDPQ